jgi:hypothetical protein
LAGAIRRSSLPLVVRASRCATVPTLLLFGVYNKIVKLHGSDRSERMQQSH